MNDPIRWQGPPRYRTGKSLIDLMDHMQTILIHVRFPFVIFHGTDDAVVSSSGSEDLFNLSMTPDEDKEFHLIMQAFHDLVNDPSMNEVFVLETDWMKRRCVSLKSS